MAVTHDMIAAKLSINRTTVTKALKGDPSIKKATRKKVLETATLMGYDFKQSQQNRREGKRYFIQEQVNFYILDLKGEEVLVEGQGLLTNLSNTGALVQLTNDCDTRVPLRPYLVRIKFIENPDSVSLPDSRVVRVNYHNHAEMATKFTDGQTLDEELLLSLESKAFNKVDQHLSNNAQ